MTENSLSRAVQVNAFHEVLKHDDEIDRVVRAAPETHVVALIAIMTRSCSDARDLHMSYFIPPGPPPSHLMPSRSVQGKKRQSTGNAPAIPSEHAALLATITDEVRDIGRVQRQGQEEDLRDALGRMMLRVEELVRICL